MINDRTFIYKDKEIILINIILNNKDKKRSQINIFFYLSNRSINILNKKNKRFICKFR